MENVIIANPSSVAEAWEMICPGCRRDDSIRIKATIAVLLYRDGTDPTDSDTEWDDASICFCAHRGFPGPARDFSDAFTKNGSGGP